MKQFEEVERFMPLVKDSIGIHASRSPACRLAVRFRSFNIGC